MTSTPNSVPSEFDPKAVENTLAFFAGYSGWDHNQLKNEIENNDDIS